MCPPYDRNQGHFSLFLNKYPPRLDRYIEYAIQRFKIMIEHGFMNQKKFSRRNFNESGADQSSHRVLQNFINRVSQIANWSPKADDLMKKGKEIIDTLRQGWEGEDDREGVESLMLSISPYELVIKIMIEEQIDRDTRPRDQLSGLTFNLLV